MEKYQKQIEFITKNFTTINVVCFLLECNLFIFQCILKKGFFIFSFFLFFLSFFSFLFLKNEIENKKLNQFLFQCNLFLGALLFANGIFISIFAEARFLKQILLFLDLGLFITCLSLLLLEDTRLYFKEFLDTDYKKQWITKENTIKKGDAVLGYEIDESGKITKNPVVLPLKDRFLHMLILGPTGCGKTSQSIIPMINRDMENLDMGITVLEPKGDLAEKVFAMAEHYNREVIYFNPILPDCPYFNPLYGNENDAVENMATTFNMLNPDSPQFFKDMAESLIRRCIKVLKRTYGNDATLLQLNTLVFNPEGQGEKILQEFAKVVESNPEIKKENDEIRDWILSDYYSGLSGDRGATKTYEHCSGVRSQISKLVSNKYLRRVLNPPPGHGSDLDFDDAFARGIVITIGTAQGTLRDLGRYLGYFIILQLQASVFRRPGNENTRRHNMLYIDEFQVYSNPGFADMLTMGRSYRVASHLATQARNQIGMGGGKDGENFVKLVSTNARNKIIYPGVSYDDADYYSKEFGTYLKKETAKSYAKPRFFGSLSDQRVTVQTKETEASNFSATDIIYREFGEITYCIVKGNTVQAPGVSRISYIDAELNAKLDQRVEEYNNLQKEKEKQQELRYQLMEDTVTTTINIPMEQPIMETIESNIKAPDEEVDIDNLLG